MRLFLSGATIDKASAVGDPKWNKVALPGKFYRPDFPGGSLDLDRAAFELMIANWRRMGGQALPVDRHHWGDSNDTRIRAEDKGAVGWMEDLRLGDDGSLEALIAWNDDGREEIAKDRLRYFSPSFAPQALDRHTGKPQGWTLYGGGLLNDPFLTELPRMAASAEPTPTPPEQKKMNAHLIAALALIGLTESSTEADVTAAKELLEGERAKLAADKDAAVKLAATSGAGVEALKLALATEKTERVNLAAEVEALKTAARDTAIDAEAVKLFKAGKLAGGKTENFKKLALGMGLPFAVETYGSAPAVDLTEKGHAAGEEMPTERIALNAKYEAELDALIKGGLSSASAAAKLAQNKAFNPLFSIANLNPPTAS